MHYKTLPMIIKFLDLHEVEFEEIITINLNEVRY